MSNQPPPPHDPDLGPGGLPRHPGTPPESVPAASAEQPASIRTAVRLMWVGAALSLLSLVTTFAAIDTIKEEVRNQVLESDADATQAMVDGVTAFAIGFAVFFSLVGVGLWLWMAWKNGQGRKWARIVATILGGANVLSALASSSSGGTTGIAMLLTLVSLVLAATILVLLWRKDSTAFYEARSAPAVG